MAETTPPRPIGGRRMPTSPFEIEATKEAVNRRIEAGDISQADLDLLKKGYRWMTLSSFIGSMSLFIPTIIVMRRRRPQPPFGVRLLAAGGMGMLGSFLGFTLGGVAAAMEVNRGMQDPKRKMQVFSEIAMEARQKALEHSGVSPGQMEGGGSSPYPNRQGAQGQGQAQGQGGASIPRRFPRPAPPSVGGEETWGEDDGSRGEREEELAREREYDQDVKMLDRDGQFASDNEFDQGMSTSTPASRNQPSPSPPMGSSSTAGGGGSTWDRLRQKAFPGQSQSSGGDGMRTGSQGTVDDMRSKEMRDTGAGRIDVERSKEQKEFDDMLERERRGEGETQTWK